MVKTRRNSSSDNDNLQIFQKSSIISKLKKAKEHSSNVYKYQTMYQGKDNIHKQPSPITFNRLVRASTPPDMPLDETTNVPKQNYPKYYLPQVIESFQSLNNLSQDHCRYLNHFQFVRQCFDLMRTLPEIPNQYEQCSSSSNKKLLVLDLDETLIHTFMKEVPENCEQITVKIPNKFEKTIHFKIRPFCKEFLNKVSQFFDICVFTAAHSSYANPILDALDPEGCFFKDRYFNDSCTKINQYTVKDLRILKSDLKDVILVDNTALCFGLQKENGVPIVCYTGQETDQELNYLSEFLLYLNTFEDVREGIMRYFKWDKFSKLYRDTAALHQYYF